MSAAASSTCCCSAMPCRRVLALLLSYAVAGRAARAYANTIAAGALILALAYVTLEIRRLYHGPVTDATDRPRAPSNTPIRLPGSCLAWCCSAIGILFNSQRARLASAAVIALTIVQGVPDRHVDADRRLPRAVLHVPRHGAGGDRLALPAHPVPEDAGAAARPRCGAGGTGIADPDVATERRGLHAILRCTKNRAGPRC